MRYLLLIILVGIPLQTQAQSAAAFSRLGTGARALGMGNAGTADIWGFGNAFFNPATTPFRQYQHLELNVSKMTFDRKWQTLEFATPMKPTAGISATITQGGVSNIDGRDGSGYHTDTYSTNDFTARLSFGTKVGKRKKTAIGMRFSYFRSELFEYVEPVNMLGSSFAIASQVHPNIGIGVVVDDLLARYSWDTGVLYEGEGRETIDYLPIRSRIGVSYQSNDKKLIVSADAERISEKRQYRYTESTYTANAAPIHLQTSENVRIKTARYRLGAEYKLAKPLSVRSGVELGAGFFAPSAGFSIHQKIGELPLQVDYALKREAYNTGFLHLLGVNVGL